MSISTITIKHFVWNSKYNSTFMTNYITPSVIISVTNIQYSVIQLKILLFTYFSVLRTKKQNIWHYVPLGRINNIRNDKREDIET
jgi:hypothetical protein